MISSFTVIQYVYIKLLRNQYSKQSYELIEIVIMITDNYV